MVIPQSLVNARLPVRSAHEVLAEARSLVEPASRAAIGTLPAPVGQAIAHHFGWLNQHERPDRRVAGGKGIRAALVLLSARAAGAEQKMALSAAVAVELVHNFSLLHDDVIDGDVMRRGRPAVWYAFGTGTAILAGDSLLASAGSVVAQSGHPRAATAVAWLNNAVQELIAGEAADVAFEDREDITLRECLDMVRHKTAALIGTSCALGALFGGATPHGSPVAQ